MGTTSPDIRVAALHLARLGWAVMPLSPREKVPVKGSHGCHDASCDEVIVSSWWDRWPGANLGVATGEVSGLVVIDIDGPEGAESWAKLEADHGGVRTLAQRTGREDGGRQLFFRHPGGKVPNRASVLPGIDVRGDGGYVVVPPSVHPSGRRYTWEGNGEPAEMPAWLRGIIAPKKSSPRPHPQIPASPRSPGSNGTPYGSSALLDEAHAVASADSGRRNEALNIAACKLGGLVAGGELDEDAVRCQLLDAALTAGLEEKEALKTIASGLRAGAATPRAAPPKLEVRSPRNGGAPPPTDHDSPAGLGEPERPWDERHPLGTKEGVPTLEAEQLPAAIRPWLVDVAEHACFPLEMPAVPALVALSSLIGRKLGVRPELSSTWTVVPNLWGGLVARPGWKKSMAIETGTSPLGPLIADAREDYERQRLEVEAKRIALDAQIASAKRRTRDPVEPAELEQLLRDRERCRLAPRRYMTSDATVEKLGEILRDNPRGILLQRDELAGWITAMSRPDRAGDREFYLEAWSGTGSFTVDRIQRGTIYIPALCLSVVGSIQPGKLLAHIRSATASGGGADGLLQRIQLLVWPDRLPDYRHCDRRPDREARDLAFAAYAQVDRLDAEDVGAERYDSGIPFLRFREDAQELVTEWMTALETRLRSDELEPTPAFESHLAKYRSLLPSLALVFHLIDRPEAGPIGIEPTVMAIEWCRFLEAHARRVYAVELRPGLAAAELLAQKISARAIEHCSSLRDIYRAHWEGLNTPEVVDAGLRELERAGWVRRASESTGGRPTSVIQLHPELRP